MFSNHSIQAEDARLSFSLGKIAHGVYPEYFEGFEMTAIKDCHFERSEKSSRSQSLLLQNYSLLTVQGEDSWTTMKWACYSG